MRLLIFFLLAIVPTHGDDFSRDFWLGYFKATELDSKNSMWTETQLRYNIESSEMDQTLIRGGLLRNISETSHRVGFLYAYIHTSLSKEHRAAFQHTMRYNILDSRLSHRIRFEYRTLENDGPLSERFRYLLRFQGETQTRFGKPVAWDEIFFNFENSRNNSIDYLDRNRLFLGFRKKFDNMDLEYGYLNQLAPRKNIGTMDHVLVAYFFL